VLVFCGNNNQEWPFRGKAAPNRLIGVSRKRRQGEVVPLRRSSFRRKPDLLAVLSAVVGLGLTVTLVLPYL